MRSNTIRTFDFIKPETAKFRADREKLQADIAGVRNLKSLDAVTDIMERVKSAIADIEAGLEAASIAEAERVAPGGAGWPDPAEQEAYIRWREAAEYSLRRYRGALKMIDGYRHSLRIREKNRREAFKQDRQKDNILAARRKLAEARIQATYQLSKDRVFIELLRQKGILSDAQWQGLWDEAEQEAFDRRHEFETKRYPALQQKVRDAIAGTDHQGKDT